MLGRFVDAMPVQVPAAMSDEHRLRSARLNLISLQSARKLSRACRCTSTRLARPPHVRPSHFLSNKKLSYHLENRASAVCISFHDVGTLKNLDFLFGFFWSENLLSKANTPTVV